MLPQNYTYYSEDKNFSITPSLGEKTNLQGALCIASVKGLNIVLKSIGDRNSFDSILPKKLYEQ